MRTTRARWALVSGAATALTVAVSAPASAASTTIRLSSTSAGAPANDTSEYPGLSDNGRYATFNSFATNLVPGDPSNFSQDVFLKDRSTGAVEQISVNSQGVTGNNSSGGFAASPVSPDGRFVAFDSFAYNLVPNDANQLTDTFLRDRQARTTVRVSVSTAGAQADGGNAVSALSADGRYVLFDSRATTLVGGDTNHALDGFMVMMLMTYALAPPDTWVLPSGGFFAGLGLGAVAAFAVSLIALPFMDIATRHDNIRFEWGDCQQPSPRWHIACRIGRV